VPTPTDIAQFDRAGVWINDSAKGFKIVDLVAGGPADAAGLKVGDEITAVDDAPSASIRLTDMRQKLRDTPAGTVLKLTVDRGGQTQVVSLTLKDQI
jgi:C-terminal processing protease CtpA/Prc